MDKFGKVDAYCIVTLDNREHGGQTYRRKTKVIKKNYNPQFLDEQYDFEVKDYTNQELVVSVWDWDAGSEDDLIGSVSVKLSALASRKKIEEVLYPIKNEAGDDVIGFDGCPSMLNLSLERDVIIQTNKGKRKGLVLGEVIRIPLPFPPLFLPLPSLPTCSPLLSPLRSCAGLPSLLSHLLTETNSGLLEQAVGELSAGPHVRGGEQERVPCHDHGAAHLRREEQERLVLLHHLPRARSMERRKVPLQSPAPLPLLLPLLRELPVWPAQRPDDEVLLPLPPLHLPHERLLLLRRVRARAGGCGALLRRLRVLLHWQLRLSAGALPLPGASLLLGLWMPGGGEARGGVGAGHARHIAMQVLWMQVLQEWSSQACQGL
mmetsp:Transcript_48797/g.153157  ORF Transcript_48797/g.153157 Transcript_48797/m.153157 type:complete len:376 (+) Transcript_48797:643-1770(+)